MFMAGKAILPTAPKHTPKKCLPPNPRTCESITLHGERGFADTIKLKILRWEVILGYLDGPDINTRVLVSERGGYRRVSATNITCENLDQWLPALKMAGAPS